MVSCQIHWAGLQEEGREGRGLGLQEENRGLGFSDNSKSHFKGMKAGDDTYIYCILV
jgi:hypothetical protein